MKGIDIFLKSFTNMRYLGYSYPNMLSVKILNKIPARPQFSVFDFARANGCKTLSEKEFGHVSVNLSLSDIINTPL
mgnify:CR=1 FL=1